MYENVKMISTGGVGGTKVENGKSEFLPNFWLASNVSGPQFKWFAGSKARPCYRYEPSHPLKSGNCHN